MCKYTISTISYLLIFAISVLFLSSVSALAEEDTEFGVSYVSTVATLSSEDAAKIAGAVAGVAVSTEEDAAVVRGYLENIAVYLEQISSYMAYFQNALKYITGFGLAFVVIVLFYFVYKFFTMFF